jgi:hypothetical protein
VAVAGALAFAATSTAGPARADGGMPRLSVEWNKLEKVLREGPGFLLPRPVDPSISHEARSREGEGKWFGSSPDLSVVLRDWGGSQPLLGQLTLIDQLRLSRSSRMFVSRVRLTDGRFAPFAHVGVGQWRVDTDLMPVLPRDVELALQLGVGFEAAIAQRVVLAIEGHHTLLIRDRHEPQMVASPYLWGVFLAARAQF